jgi:hypothetical protein
MIIPDVNFTEETTNRAICLSFVAMFFLSLSISYAQNSSITIIPPSGTVSGQVGTQFSVDIKVGDPVAASNLIGLSFTLALDSTTYLEAVQSTSGSLLGGNSMIVAQNFMDHIELGVTSTTGGKSGSGVVATCTFRVKQTAEGIPISFSLQNVTAIDANGSSMTLAPVNNPRHIVIGTDLSAKPAPPVLVSPLNNSMKQPLPVNLQWTAPDTARSYHVLVATDTGFTQLISNDSLTTTSKQLTLLNYSTTYYWKVSAKNQNGEGAFSHAWTFKTLPQPVMAPGNVKADASVSKKITLTWTDNSSNEAGFSIRRKDGDTTEIGLYQSIGTVKNNITTFTDTTVANAKQYSYQIYAFSTDSIFGYSNQVSILSFMQRVSIKIIPPSGTISGQAGTEFSVDIKIGDPSAASNLVGLSFDLAWDNSTYLESVLSTAGGLFGSNSIIIAPNFPDHIELGVTSTTGGKFGNGIGATCTFRVRQAAQGIPIALSLKNLTAKDAEGTVMSLIPVNNPQQIMIGSVPVIAPSNLKAIASVSKRITLTWVDNSNNESGFFILRKDGDTSGTGAYQPVGSVKENVTLFTDSTIVDARRYSYQVSAVSADSSVSFSNQISIINTVTSVIENGTHPEKFEVIQNYPNPFNPTTRIKIMLPAGTVVSMSIFNSLGQEVERVIDTEKMSSGVYEYDWHAANEPSGMYMCRLQTDHAISVLKMILAK